MHHLMQLLAGVPTEVYIMGTVAEFGLMAAVLPFVVRKLRKF